ncbi:hypothetical protein DY000_02033253 [Brassica cretica]|uniref:OCRE domain-containing protein n=1 Tax=Brassica cretica TaxID=69181 RepID=A0ABQ7DF09_BRACR|nr:hypothetical protein DY000_02033253 [Brassica cretica]
MLFYGSLPTHLPHDRLYPFRPFHFSIFERTTMPRDDGDNSNRSVSTAATSMLTAIIDLLSKLGFLHTLWKSTEYVKIYVVSSVLTIVTIGNLLYGDRRTGRSSLRFLRLIRSSDFGFMGFDPGSGSDQVIQLAFCLKMLDGYSVPVIEPNMAAHITSALQRKHGKPQQEFVKSLCIYKDIYELRNRVEAFALHASGYYYNQTNGLHYELDSRFNYSDSIGRWVTQDEAFSAVSAALSVGRREVYALFVEEALDLSSIHRKKEAMKSFESHQTL